VAIRVADVAADLSLAFDRRRQELGDPDGPLHVDSIDQVGDPERDVVNIAR